MTDTEKKIAEIREALEKATPGPWAVFVGEGWTEEYPRNTYVQAVWNEPDHRGSFGYRVARMAGVHGRTMADAHLIANAPEWLCFLLSELERKNEVIEEQKRELFYKSKEITELREKSWQDQQWFKQASANITEMQKELDCEREENRKLREENSFQKKSNRILHANLTRSSKGLGEII